MCRDNYIVEFSSQMLISAPITESLPLYITGKTILVLKQCVLPFLLLFVREGRSEISSRVQILTPILETWVLPLAMNFSCLMTTLLLPSAFGKLLLFDILFFPLFFTSTSWGIRTKAGRREPEQMRAVLQCFFNCFLYPSFSSSFCLSGFGI